MPSDSAVAVETDVNQTASAGHDQAASVDSGDDNNDGAVDGPMVVAYVDLARKIGERYQSSF